MTTGGSNRALTGPGLFLVGTVAAAGAAGVVVATASYRITSLLSAVTVGGVVASILLLELARHTAGRRLSLLYLTTVLWLVYFPVRLLVIESDRTYFTLHPVVQSASDGQLVWAWIVSLLGLLALILGARLAKRFGPRPIQRWTNRSAPFKTIAAVGLGWSILTVLVSVKSGLLTNVGPLALCGIAGLAFLDARQGRIRLTTIAYVAVGILLGSVFSFKELATLPVLSWALGYVAGRESRPPLWMLAAGTILCVVAFLGVDGQRIAAKYERPGNIVTETGRALIDYDLRTGTRAAQPKHGAELVTNLGQGLSRRLSGVEALLIFHQRVPADVGFAHGRSIVDPLVSLLPGAGRFLGNSEFRQLSLGRWYQQNLYSVRPLNDLSSQSMTWPGDLYLNFGVLGVLVGLALMGLLIGLFDMAFPTTSAFGCGVLAYAGTALLGIERNVSYALAITGIRLAVVLVVVQVLSRRNVEQPRVLVASP